MAVGGLAFVTGFECNHHGAGFDQCGEREKEAFGVRGFGALHNFLCSFVGEFQIRSNC